MRQIVLDTETTGLDPQQGHRIIEIAGVELLNRRLTGRHFHCYLNPERDSDPGALQVHGLTTEFLADKPKFKEIVAEFLDYIQGAELIIHNAPFDLGFLNKELDQIALPAIENGCPSVIDTLKLAKEMFPGKRNNLNALCERYQIDNAARTLHGALLDAELLADVYLAMTRGQESLMIEIETVTASITEQATQQAYSLVVLTASEEEQQAHERYLDEMERANKQACLWRTAATPAESNNTASVLTE